MDGTMSGRAGTRGRGGREGVGKSSVGRWWAGETYDVEVRE